MEELDATEREWLPAVQALRLVQDLIQEDAGAAAIVLTRWAASGAVTTRCRVRREWADDDLDVWDSADLLSKAGDDFWHHFAEAGKEDGSNWKVGWFRISWYSEGTYKHESMDGVEFDALEIRRVAPPLLPSSVANGGNKADVEPEPQNVERVNRRGFPRLSASMLADWHKLFVEAYPNGNASQAWESVNGMFPKHHIARERIRELFSDVPVGRPRESKD